ncbi:peptide chain release factor subunit 3 [Fistulifera solaris]|uniref:Peptide chain release factor subunit 3 n=1 Tax=Fistulifera solaris TaxID=1519565 RepID=A0A1Z5KGS5_FISSO|nr:peptide chain release factor subunit 3 [Fistulifera solaris]|eukprot:GAX25315.1 peptide chain release factor subunit 3 [Fistulifera solaris]
MNPQATEWKPSVAAAPWTPGGGVSVPAPTPNAAPEPESNEDEIDEQDPLWQAVLKISDGDREKALKLINNPDELAAYPEIQKILEETGGDAAEDEESELVQDVEEKAKIEDSMEDEAESEAPAKPVKEGDPREHLNLVFIGHVDAGKSTLSGNILYLTDNVDKRTIERYEREAKALNRDSWFLAFIMDTDEGERAKGKTVEVGKARFETENKRYTIMDAPGHKNYVPNMIQGASQADIGILVISARKGEFETGFDRGGQTREHALLAKTLGVDYLIVAVNKMDEPTVKWSKERFEECISKIRPYLKSCGFTIKTQVKFIPISGLGGANVKDEVSESECSWWKEFYTTGQNNTDQPTLFKLLDSLIIPGRDATAPVRIPVLDRYSERGTIAMGKVESGTLRPGSKVTVMPTGMTYKVDEVWVNDDESIAAARPGESVLVKLNGARLEDIRKGYVLCSDPPCRAVDKLICQVAIMDMPDNTKIMTAGFQCVFHAHTCEEECTITRIFETTNPKGQVMKGARFAGIGMRAIVMIELSQSTPLDTYDNMHFLGRFTLRTEGKTIAIGKITKLPPPSA